MNLTPGSFGDRARWEDGGGRGGRGSGGGARLFLLEAG